MENNWYQKTTEQVLNEFGTPEHGLSSDVARMRLQEHGPNELEAKKRKTALAMFLDQFRDFMILVLIGAALISGVIGELSDTIAIVVIVFLNAVIGFIQEFRAERAMEALKKMAAPNASVFRDGNPVIVPASALVPGDLVLLEAGQIVPADIRLTETVQLMVREAALTGESLPMEKSTRPVSRDNVLLGDRLNMAFKGTTVSYGRGRGVVVGTGMKTELGKIASLLQGEEEMKTPLQKRLAVFGRKLAIAVLVICAIVFAAGVLRGGAPLLMLLTAISLAVAAIPEALPAVVTISLAIGAKKLVRQNALVRKLPAVETLGSVTYICSDKTGTLTMNRMRAEEVYINGAILKLETLSGNPLDGNGPSSPEDLLLTALALCNDAHPNSEGEIIGDPTEAALLEVAESKGFHKETLDKKFPRIMELPFDAERKSMTTVHSFNGGYISFTKGAAESLIEKSGSILTGEGAIQIDAGEIRNANDAMAAAGLRVLCIAMRRWTETPSRTDSEFIETDLTILGMIGLLDPERKEAAEAVSLCKSAGIMPVMITGDHPLTAGTIAGRIGILPQDSTGTVLTGQELGTMSAVELDSRVERVRVYARVAPEQKFKIVKALQEKGEFVAMTGDGVNDAPALKRADIGIAMGITGTDVAKEASDLILLDDNFSTIVQAVSEGRKIYDNIRKFIKYLLTTNSGEIWTLFLAPFIGLPIPLLPIQILWINLVTDGLPALALSAEPAEADVMKRPPRHPQESIFAHGIGLHAVWVGLLMGGVVLSAQFWAIKTEEVHWRTIVFTILCLTQLGHVLAIRSETRSFFTMGAFSNRYLTGAVLIAFFLQMATIYIPALNPVFRTEPLTTGEMAITLALSSTIFFAVEAEKFFKRRKRKLDGFFRI